MLMGAATVVHCSCASVAGLVLSFIACFILLVIAPLVTHSHYHIMDGRVSVSCVCHAPLAPSMLHGRGP